MEPNVIIPALASTDGYVELSRTKDYRGKHWRKHILTLGDLIHPATGQKLTLDEDFYSKLAANFDAGVADIVAVPLADKDNKHTEDPLANSGEVLGIAREGNKVYVDLDIRNPKVHEGLKNKTLLGASAFMSLDYKDSRTGQKVGPALLHSCITNRPYVLGLDDYEEVVAATASDSEGDVVVLAQEELLMDKAQLLAALRDEHGIDVEALQADATQQNDLSSLTAALTAALGKSPDVKLSAGEDGTVSLTDVVGAVAELADANVTLSGSVKALQLTAAENEIDSYIAAGRALPKQREAMIKLAMEDRPMLTALLPTEPVVKLNAQTGAAPPQGEGQHSLDIDGEVARLTAEMDSMTKPKGARK